MLNDKSQSSLYRQLKEKLVSKIQNNEWKNNTKIPTERQLCDLYSVSRITVRQALDELEKEGFLYRKQGKGTFVTTPKMEQRLNSFYSFSEEIRKMGFEPGARILKFEAVKASETVAAHLQIEAGARIYSIERLRLANGDPFALETSYIPEDLFPDLEASDIEACGLYNTMKDKYSVVPDEAAEVFEAVLISKTEAAALEIKRNSPGLHLERSTYAGDRVVEFCDSIIRGDRYKYRVVLK